MYELIHDYESNVHRRKPDSMNEKFVKDFMAMSPLYDPQDPDAANAPSEWEGSLEFKDSMELNDLKNAMKINRAQYPPNAGSYHMYHRIDGELVAIGVCDITEKYFNSAYFIYKSKYAYLNLGVVGAIIEIEFCRKLSQLWAPNLQYYHLGELVLDCPKVNYKMNYQPGQVLCPYTKEWAPFDQAKPEILKLMNMKKNEKLLY